MDTLSEIWNSFISAINATEINTVGSIYKLILSMILGGAVGYERKRKGQTAGVRTFALISMGASLAMLLSVYVPQVYLGLKNGDPSRIAAQVVSGIGFLGAGAIIQMKGSVRGLTTAASIWMVAAIGMSVGMGLYTVSIIATLLILFILAQLEKIEHHFSIGSGARTIRINVTGIVSDVNSYKDCLKRNHIILVNMLIDYNYEKELTCINFVVLARETVDFIKVFDEIRNIHPTTSLTLSNQLNG